MRNGDIIRKRNGELLSELLEISEEVFAARTLREIMTAPQAIKGIGKKEVEKISILKELSRRWFMTPNSRQKVDGAEDVARYLMPRLKDENQEHLIVVVLNTRHVIIAAPTVSIGSLTGAVVHPREVFQAAIYYSAAAVILVHNHPSGDPSPSNPDKKVTKRIFQCGKIMEIPVLDHVIIGNLLFYSFKEDKIQSLTY